MAFAELDIRLDLVVLPEVCPFYLVASGDTEPLRRTTLDGFCVVECSSQVSEAVLLKALRHVELFGMQCILAHPERAPALSPTFIQSSRKRGHLAQIVAPSVVGGSGRAVQARAFRLAERQLVDLLASDAHGSHRPSALPEAVAALDDPRFLGVLSSALERADHLFGSVRDASSRRPSDSRQLGP